MPVKKATTATGKKTVKKVAAEGEPRQRREKATETPVAGFKLRIKLRAYDHKLIDNSARQITDIANRYGAEIMGPVPLPTEVQKYTVNRSSFIHKNAREQFEMRVHKRIIDIVNPNNEIIEALRDMNLPSGVDITIKI